MENLRENVLGLEEEVLQRGSDAPEVSLRELRKVRPELLTTDPELQKYMPDGAENMDEGEYLSHVMKALGKEFGNLSAEEFNLDITPIDKLVRKHPKQLGNIFKEVDRLQEGNIGEEFQGLRNTMHNYDELSKFDVSYYQNRKSRNESREEYRERTKDDVSEKKSQARQNLINNAPFGR